MINLLKSEFIRFRKDNSFIIGLIICFIVAFILVGMNLIMKFMFEIPEIKEQLIKSGIDPSMLVQNGKTLYYSSISFSNNFGLIIPIVLSIYVTRDFSFGTIRNKLIMGYSRVKIYLSTLISGTIFGTLLLIVSLVFTFLLAILTAGYGMEFSGSEFLNIIKVLILTIIIYLVVYSGIIALAMVSQRLLIPILISLLGLVLLGSIIPFFMGYNDVIDFLIVSTPFGQVTKIINSLSDASILDFKFFLHVVISSACFISLFSILGIVKFQRVDVK